MRGRGGANNKLGKRRLKHLTNEELKSMPAAIIAARYQVHIATVYAETRFRKKELRDAILLDHANRSVQEGKAS